MMTVNEMSKRTGVSVRTLHYYDMIGLLLPDKISTAGYRLYGAAALDRLSQILLYRELQFPLKEIKAILDSPDFDGQRALEQQLHLLQLKKEHLENLIDLALGIKMIGVKHMDFTVFDTKKIDDYARHAKESWGQTEAYREYEKKTGDYTKEDWALVSTILMQNFSELGKMRDLAPDSDAVQGQVEKLRQDITEHFYTCTPEILASLGSMYSGGGSLSASIDQAGGKGTAEFAGKAIEAYCENLIS